MRSTQSVARWSACLSVVLAASSSLESVPAVGAEKPRAEPQPPKHVLGDPAGFDRDMAHISDEALVAALDLDRPGLRAVRAETAKDARDALAAFCHYLAQRDRPVDTLTAESYRAELDACHRAFPARPDSLARMFNSVHEWTLADADRAIGGTHMYAGSKTGWVTFQGGRVDWVTNHGNIYGFHYFGSLKPLFLAWLATGEARYARAYAAAFDDWWEQRDGVRPQWCVWYKLGLAIRGRRLARALHHMAKTRDFTVQTRTRMLKTILGSCRWLMRDWKRAPAWASNWGLFVATGLVRMGTLFPEFREADAWVRQGETILKRYAVTFKPDGGTEAPSYHNGILLSLAHPDRLLRANGRAGYLSDPGLRRGIARGMRLHARTTMPDGRYPAIGDAFFGDPAEAIAAGAELLEDAELKSAVVGIGGAAIARNGAFHIPGRPPFRTVAELRTGFLPHVPLAPWRPGSYVFPNHGLTVLRKGDTPADAVYLAVSHGVYGHWHPDFLGITVFAHGRLLLGDRGVPCYYGPHTGEMRRSRAHSCLVVDGANMKGVKPQMTVSGSSADADLWQCRSTGYGHLGVANTRTIVSIKRGGGCFVIVDKVDRTSDAERQLDVYFHTHTHAVRIESPRRILVGEGPVLTIVAPAGNGGLHQGKEWAILPETALVTRQFPYVAFRKVSTGPESFCSVLAADPKQARSLDVVTRRTESGAMEVTVTEGPAQYRVVVARKAPGQGKAEAQETPWKLVAGAGQPVQLFTRSR